jgi:hypothetical protein
MATYCSGGEGGGAGGGGDSWSCTEKLILLNSSLSISVLLTLLFRCRQILPIYYFTWIRTGIQNAKLLFCHSGLFNCLLQQLTSTDVAEARSEKIRTSSSMP